MQKIIACQPKIFAAKPRYLEPLLESFKPFSEFVVSEVFCMQDVMPVLKIEFEEMGLKRELLKGIHGLGWEVCELVAFL